MNKAILMVSILMFSVSSFANFKRIKCSGPTGGKVTSVEGAIQLSKTETEQMYAEGAVSVNGGASIKVIGGYDKMGATEYAIVGPQDDSKNNQKVSALYIDFTDSEDAANSYIEISDKMYPLNCGMSK